MISVFILFFILFGLLCVALAALQIARRARERRIRTAAFARSWSAHYQRHAAHARIVWAEPVQILRLIDGGAEIVVFRLIEHEESRRRPVVFRGEIPVMIEELEATVPWIPLTNRIVVHHSGGIDAALARTIAASAHGREVMLIPGVLPERVEQRLEMAGDVCN